MDNSRSFMKFWQKPEEVDYEECNVVIFSDGGFRNTHCAAFAWAMFWATRSSSANTWQYYPLAVKGEFLTCCDDSFVAEALALESAARYMNRYVRKRAGAQ
eukprot:1288-Karenia_brevis.AAC.1